MTGPWCSATSSSAARTTGGGGGRTYLFLYAAFYFFAKLDTTKVVSGALYFGYMLVASYAFFTLTGTVGFYACFCFTSLIYSSLEID
uniref:Transmembrane 9 superfamily member n=1 Tax=Triticum urartu TaxID=4572 RepID=A0A8R7VCR6_TRIUA